MTILLLVIFCFAIPDFSYLYWRLGNGPLDAFFLSLPFLLLATFPLKKIHRVHRQMIYLSLGVITYLTLMSLVRDLILLGFGTLLPAWYVTLATTVVMAGGFLHAWLGPHVKHTRLPVQNLHVDLEGFKIVQISDLHVGPTIRKRYVQKVVDKCLALKPDIVTLTGDIGDGPVKLYRQDIQPFSALRGKYGTFYVTGNHEYYWNGQDWLNAMNEFGMSTLVNRGEVFSVNSARVLVGGVPDPVSRINPEVQMIADLGRESDFKILLSHRPGVARAAEAAGFDLQLSGHTHGGQFFPWTLVVKFVHEFSRGLGKLENMWVYVNMGTGSWGPFLRVGSTTEISLLELVNVENVTGMPSFKQARQQK